MADYLNTTFKRKELYFNQSKYYVRDVQYLAGTYICIEIQTEESRFAVKITNEDLQKWDRLKKLNQIL